MAIPKKAQVAVVSGLKGEIMKKARGAYWLAIFSFDDGHTHLISNLDNPSVGALMDFTRQQIESGDMHVISGDPLEIRGPLKN